MASVVWQPQPDQQMLSYPSRTVLNESCFLLPSPFRILGKMALHMRPVSKHPTALVLGLPNGDRLKTAPPHDITAQAIQRTISLRDRNQTLGGLPAVVACERVERHYFLSLQNFVALQA